MLIAATRNRKGKIGKRAAVALRVRKSWNNLATAAEA
jgi:hypothetical protein